ncbi:hypothetical protein [Crocosphaera sp.]|uniref:hypothetical protein n=1 Tax=Crocosphaera sp. TaxID=2729996 RepID=UPI003F2856A1|nr:hypothetical protein [Crocosphaera sp.]
MFNVTKTTITASIAISLLAISQSANAATFRWKGTNNTDEIVNDLTLAYSFPGDAELRFFEIDFPALNPGEMITFNAPFNSNHLWDGDDLLGTNFNTWTFNDNPVPADGSIEPQLEQIPESSSNLSLLALGILGAGSTLLRKKKGDRL